MRTYDNIQKIATGQGDDYTTGCLLDYHYFKDYSEMIAIDSSKQPALEADLKAMQQISFTGNLENQSGIFSIIKETEETILDFSQGPVQVF